MLFRDRRHKARVAHVEPATLEPVAPEPVTLASDVEPVHAAPDDDVDARFAELIARLDGSLAQMTHALDRLDQELATPRL